MASEPDAYGYMGMGVSLIGAAAALILLYYLPVDIGLPHAALTLGILGGLFFLVGRSHERAVLEEEMDDV